MFSRSHQESIQFSLEYGDLNVGSWRLEQLLIFLWSYRGYIHGAQGLAYQATLSLSRQD